MPVGTVIRDTESGKVIADLFDDGETFVALKGGRGGKGNNRFAHARRQAPSFSQLGETTEEHQVTLELKTIADVGLVGFRTSEIHAFVRFDKRKTKDRQLSFHDDQSESWRRANV